MAVVDEPSPTRSVLHPGLFALGASDDASVVQRTAVTRLQVDLRRGCGLKEADLTLVRSRSGAVRTPFQTAEWLDAFGVVDDACQKSRVLAIIHAEGRPAALLPLQILEFGPLRYLTWQAHVPSDYCAPVVAGDFLPRLSPAEARQVMEEIARRIGGIDLIYLPKMPDMLGRCRNPFVDEQSWRFYAGCHAIRIVGAWDAFYAGIRGPRTRQSVKRKEKALRALGRVEFRVAYDPENVLQLVQSCLDMKASQLLRDGHANLFADQRMAEALRTAMLGACPDRAWAASLDLDGRAVATAFGMIDGDKWLLYQLTMSDGPESKSSPGILLLVELLKVCVDRKVELLDLGLGDEAYKLEWCNHHSGLRSTAVPLTPLGTIAAATLRARERARIWLAKDPAKMKFAKRVKPLLARIRINA